MAAEDSKHRSSRQSRRLATWIIGLVIAIVAIIAVVVAWTVAAKDNRMNRVEAQIEECSGYVLIDIWAPTELQSSLTASMTDFQSVLSSDGGLCASFSLSAQSSSEVTADLLKKDPYLPGVWIGEKADVERVAAKLKDSVVTKPKELAGTEYAIISFDMAKNDTAMLDEITAAHPEEATKAAVSAEEHIISSGVQKEEPSAAANAS